MEAPDKIYLREFGDSLSQVWSGIKPPEGTNIASHEYIRKDALLKWAKENRDSLGRLSYGEFIDKLISL